MRNKYKYKFSVIIPIYNVERYLEETIESVINQTLNFEKNIEIILVNDGSPDNSDEICKKYTKLYPRNIKYIKQVNAGVSAARNNGLIHSKGKYINFLDSDDKWSKDVFEKALKMFENTPNLDVIGVRQKYFEATNTYASLDFKFNKDKVISIFEDYDHIQLSVTSGFIRSSAIGNIRFDTNVKYSEDAKFINEIIVKNGLLGIISSSLHYYRKRFSENSAIQVKNSNEDWYLITPLECYRHAFNLSKRLFGEVIPYFQYYVAYDYQWRIKDTIPDNISGKTIKKYLKVTKELFKDIDDNIILIQRNISSEYKIKALNIKYSNDITKKFKYIDHSLYLNGNKVIDLKNSNYLKINIINFKNNNMEIRGMYSIYLSEEDYNIYAVVNNKNRIKLNLTETKINIRKSFNEPFLYNRGFKINIPLKEFKNLYFEFVYKDLYKTKINFNSGINAKIDSKAKNYYINNKYIYYQYNSRIKRKPVCIKNKIYFKLRYIKNIIINKKFKVFFFRTTYDFFKLFKNKKIWLISDRPSTANDNGFSLFKYVCEKNNKYIKPYFIITKNSKDYDKVKKIGKPIIFNSIKYKIYFLLADKIISSQADEWVTNPFGKSQKYYSDLYNADFIFLQHGITKNDLSSWLNCYEKNIKMFVTSALNEYKSIINGNYGYKKDVIKLTGMPRYDNLNNEKRKLIAIMPTWRLSLASNINKEGIRPYNKSFKDSKYFKFYNSLINDKRLLNVMNKYGYKGVFVLHPSHVENYIDFRNNNVFEIIKGYADYQTIFKEASLLVSDYSSVLFDFGYLNKPVIYTQFDKNDFFKKNFYTEGYFNDEIDGFGPVVYDYESTINRIIKYIENDCKIEDIYSKRINSFYKYHDHDNCERVYNEIMNEG